MKVLDKWASSNGGKGWEKYIIYSFNLSVYNYAFRIQIHKSDSSLVYDSGVIHLDDPINGRYGFYNLSQDDVIYSASAIREISSNPPPPTPKITLSSTLIPTFAHTHTPTATHTLTPTITPTPTETPTATHTHTPTATYTVTPSITPTFTETATATFTPAPTVTFTWTPTQTATWTLAPSATFTPTATATLAPSPTPSLSPTPTATPTATPVPIVVHQCANDFSLRQYSALALFLQTRWISDGGSGRGRAEGGVNSASRSERDSAPRAGRPIRGDVG